MFTNHFSAETRKVGSRQFVALASAGAFAFIHHTAGRLKKSLARRNSTPQIASRFTLPPDSKHKSFSQQHQRRTSANAAVIIENAKRKRRIATKPAGNCRLTSRPRRERRDSSALDKHRKRAESSVVEIKPRNQRTRRQRCSHRPQSTAEIPAADLAPLYNYVQDCRACQLQLTAAKQNASDDTAKIRAFTRERDAVITATKGGPFWLRLKRSAHWLAIGAAIGAVTAAATLCHTGHCR